ncbi:hypothetical protein V1478_005079 [Vespula squamosa]|uniref:Uncharacterized protein n=1 Tax=Vespula squamosa TaxID=30214 RepID=A0ABD2BD49_VESSQ
MHTLSIKKICTHEDETCWAGGGYKHVNTPEVGFDNIMNIMGPLPKTKKENKYILIIENKRTLEELICSRNEHSLSSKTGNKKSAQENQQKSQSGTNIVTLTRGTRISYISSKLLSIRQFGFVLRRSTEDVIIEMPQIVSVSGIERYALREINCPKNVLEVITSKVKESKSH